MPPAGYYAHLGSRRFSPSRDGTRDLSSSVCWRYQWSRALVRLDPKRKRQTERHSSLELSDDLTPEQRAIEEKRDALAEIERRERPGGSGAAPPPTTLRTSVIVRLAFVILTFAVVVPSGRVLRNIGPIGCRFRHGLRLLPL